MGAAASDTIMNDVAQIPIGELLLQRREMLLLEQVREFSATHVEVSATVPQHHPLVDQARGMPAWVGVELMAQAVSVFSALELRACGLAPRVGLLLGARSFEARVPYFAVGALLNVRATLALRAEAGLGVFDCTIESQGALLACAQVKGYMPDDITEVLGSGAHG
jgi:predicted hotdog family 3-hydroxylacyl-ACP dehydratase